MNNYRDPAETMRRLMVQAHKTVTKCCQWNDFFEPTIFLDGLDGQMAYSPPPHLRNQTYGDLQSIAQHMSVAYRATAVVLAVEGWQCNSNLGYDVLCGLRHPPKESEVLLITGETRDRWCKQIFPVERDLSGCFRRLGHELNWPDYLVIDELRDLVPQNPVEEFTPEVRNEYRNALREEGHRIKQGVLRQLGLAR